MYFNSLIRLLILCLCCIPIFSGASTTQGQEPLLESDTSKAFRSRRGRTLQEHSELRGKLKLSKHTEPLLNFTTNENSLQELLSLQFLLSKRLTRYRATIYLHFYSILTSGYALSDTLDNSIHDLQRIQFITKRGPQAAWKNCFPENINDLKDVMKMGITEGIKDIKEKVQAVTTEMDELKEFIIDIEEKVLKLLGELENTVGEINFAEDAKNLAWDVTGALLRNK
jgi:hypothetical protein